MKTQGTRTFMFPKRKGHKEVLSSVPGQTECGGSRPWGWTERWGAWPWTECRGAWPRGWTECRGTQPRAQVCFPLERRQYLGAATEKLGVSASILGAFGAGEVGLCMKKGFGP